MPVTVIVEDGTGVTGANSYGSQADATSYFSDLNITTWAALSSDNKDFALVKGTKLIDDIYRNRWKGTRTETGQALSWPRIGVIDADGRIVNSDEIPTLLKNATFEAALITTSVSDADLYPTLEPVGQEKTIDIFEGVRVDYFQNFNTDDIDRYLSIERLLIGYLIDPPFSSFYNVPISR